MKKLISAVLCAGVMVGSFGAGSVKAESAWQLDSRVEGYVRRLWREQYGIRLKQENVDYIFTIAKSYCRNRERGVSEAQWWNTLSGFIDKSTAGDPPLRNLIRKLSITGEIVGATFYCPEYPAE